MTLTRLGTKKKKRKRKKKRKEKIKNKTKFNFFRNIIKIVKVGTSLSCGMASINVSDF